MAEGRKSRSHSPKRSGSPKQINIADIISPETLSFISKLQLLNVSKIAQSAAAGSGGASIINLNNAAGIPGLAGLTGASSAGVSTASEEMVNYNPNVGSPLLSGDFLNLESGKLIIPKESHRQPTSQEIEAYHKLKNKCWLSL